MTGIRFHSRPWPFVILPLGALVLSGCQDSSDGAEDAEAVTIVGSATVEPIARIAVRESGIDAELSREGSIAGFEEFCAGEADVLNASIRMPGSDAVEGIEDFRSQCEEEGVEFVELPIGVDALSMITNTANEDVTDITMDELAQIWGEDSEVEQWSDVRDEWPDEEIQLFGRSEDSGTFTHFTEELFGDPEGIRDDYEQEDGLAELAELVAEDENGMAFMGVGNYLAAPEEFQTDITTVTVDGVAPDAARSVEGEYPLTRTLYTYVALETLDAQEDVEAYAQRLLDNGDSILPRAFFYPLSPEDYEEASQRLEDRETGVAE